MKKTFSYILFLLVSTFPLLSCNQSSVAPQASPSLSEPASSPSSIAGSIAQDVPAASPNATTQPTSPTQSPASATEQSYKQPDGLFEIAFPSGYTFKETGSGIAFVSEDKGFAGSIDFGAANGKKLTNEQLESALKDEYQKRLESVTWQKSEEQPDGSVRVDWVAKDADGNNLDAVSFVEQRGDNIFILNLFGISKSYQDYNNDAQTIVGTYRIKQ